LNSKHLQTSAYYAKVPGRLRNTNNSFGVGQQYATNSRLNTQSNLTGGRMNNNKTNFSRYKDNSHKVNTTKNTSSSISSPVGFKNHIAKQTTSPNKQVEKDTKQVNRMRFQSQNPADKGYGFKGHSRMNTTE